MALSDNAVNYKRAISARLDSVSTSDPIMIQPIMRVWILRHGETNENHRGVIQGQLDTKLNDKGLAQAKRTADAFRCIEFRHAFTSDLLRASETARVILDYHPHIDLQFDPDARERHMGDLTGQIGYKMTAEEKAAAKASMEPYDGLLTRTMRFWRKLLDLYKLPSDSLAPPSESPHNVLVVSHGAWIAALVRHALPSENYTLHESVPQATQVHNCALSVISVYANGLGRVEIYDDYRHLMDEPTRKADDLEVSSKD